MTTKKTESEKKFKREIPEEAREHYKKARKEMRDNTFLPIPTPNDYQTTVCDNLNDGTENIDLTDYNDDLISTPTNYLFGYYTTLLGAENQLSANQITNTTAYTMSNTNNIVYVR